jgi:hypothetical protein
MNNTQRLVLSLGAWFLGLMTLVPPWQRVQLVGPTMSQTTSGGYALVFSPPASRDDWQVSYRIDWSRRMVEYLAVSAIIAAVFVGVGYTSRQPTGPAGADQPVAPPPMRSEAVPTAIAQPQPGTGLLWAPSGAAQASAMFVEVAPGLPPTRGQYLALLGTKWTGIARSAGNRELQRFLSRVGSLFPSLPDGLTADTVGEALAENDEVLEALSGQGLLAGMNQPVTADLHERLSDHGEPDLEDVLTVLENAEGSLD